ncbi:MAG: hypothetical protein ACI9OD_000236 [Limisphaerales bacterium]|jgi:hypothetical protein
MSTEANTSASSDTSPPILVEPPAAAGNTVLGEYWRWCPRCGKELENRGCKLRCARCHYFMSCSDFD